MFGPIRAVAIDDNPGHLLAITTGLTAGGIPCIGYWYDREANQLRPTPAEGGLQHLRLVLMDLNLAEQAGIPDAASLCSGVISALKQIISKDAGPYLLVFWTMVGNRATEVANLLYQRLEPVEDIPCPIMTIELSKRPFMVPDPQQQDWKAALSDFYSQLHQTTEPLRQELEKVVTRDPRLSALATWESRASEAASHAVNEVYACAKTDALQPLDRTASLEKVLAKIAVAASGPKPAAEWPSRALDAGMVEILLDQFGTSGEDPNYRDVVQAAIGKTIRGKIGFRDREKMFAVLNTFFHIDKKVGAAKAWDRGVVIPAGPPLEAAVLGFTAGSLLEGEFLFGENQFPEGQREAMSALWNECRRSAELVLVELGADCDHAQAKPRTRRYLVGLEIPVHLAPLMFSPKDKTKTTLRNGSLQLLGPWNINGRIVHLLVSCRRFWAWQGENPPQAGHVRYRLRASLVNKLLHHYSVWSSRPGVVEFR